jgi:hypothetical protein
MGKKKKNMDSSFVPLGTQAVEDAADRSPDLRCVSRLPKGAWPSVACGSLKTKRSGLQILSMTPFIETANRSGALTVAGQWRNFTAFPSILA